MQKKWTQEAWSEASGIYARIIGHPFIKELAAGTLDSARFNRYIAQDELYLGNYGRQMLAFASMLDDAAQRVMFEDFAHAGLEGERAMHDLLIGRFGTELKVDASPVTAAYNAHTEAALASGRRELALAALLPCMWVYNEVGRHIVSIAVLEAILIASGFPSTRMMSLRKACVPCWRWLTAARRQRMTRHEGR